MPAPEEGQPKRRSPVSVKLSDELESYLREKAKTGFRSLSKEIVMRLEMTRNEEGQKNVRAA